jgi:hypothetical protein
LKKYYKNVRNKKKIYETNIEKKQKDGYIDRDSHIKKINSLFKKNLTNINKILKKKRKKWSLLFVNFD